MTSHSLDPYSYHFRSPPCSLVTSSSSLIGLVQLHVQLEGLAAVCVAIGVSVFVAWAFDCLLSDNRQVDRHDSLLTSQSSLALTSRPVGMTTFVVVGDCAAWRWRCSVATAEVVGRVAPSSNLEWRYGCVQWRAHLPPLPCPFPSAVTLLSAEVHRHW